MNPRTLLTTLLLACLATLLAASNAAAAPLVTVENGNDAGPGSLREAIKNVDSGGTISIPASVGTIDLETELKIEKGITIEGAGPQGTIIDAQGKSRALRLTQNQPVKISGVQITEGKARPTAGEALGGAILIEAGSLRLTGALLVRNEADGSAESTASTHAEGGAIFGAAGTTLQLVDVMLSDNQALGGEKGRAKGGGLAADGTLAFEGGAVKGNTARGHLAAGGGVAYNGGEGSFGSLAVLGNTAESSAGRAGEVFGGGLDLEGSGQFDNLNKLTIAHNTATSQLPNGEDAEVRGGGLEFSGSLAIIVNATVAANSASGLSKGNALVQGGGIGSTGGEIEILDSTLAGNSAMGTTTGPGTEPHVLGSDIYDGGSVGFAGTLFSFGPTTSNSGSCEFAGAVNDEGHNLEDGTSCRFDAPSDIIGVVPKLGPLTNNGGELETMALLPGSPAIDAGAGDCAETDERGVLRRVGAPCDIGAFEVATPIATTGGASVGADRATISGVATNPDLAGGTVFFEYGTSPGYGSRTAPQPIGATTPGAPFSAELTGLAGLGTTYHYREVVTNGVGSGFGADRTFTVGVAPIPAPGSGRTTRKPMLTLKSLGGLRFRAHCTGAPCRGRVLASARTGKRTVVVGTAKLDLHAGATAKLTLKPTAAGKRLRALPGRLAIVVRAKLASGSRRPKPLRLSLR